MRAKAFTLKSAFEFLDTVLGDYARYGPFRIQQLNNIFTNRLKGEKLIGFDETPVIGIEIIVPDSVLIKFENGDNETVSILEFKNLALEKAEDSGEIDEIREKVKKETDL